MLDTFNFASPQSANYQEFLGGNTIRDWIKPRGVSMVRMLLIGAGGGGDVGSTSAAGLGGGSSAVTSWIGPAIFIPDELRVNVAVGGTSSTNAGRNTQIIYQAKDGTGYTLLTANGGSFNTAGAVSTNNYFGAAGIFSSIAGQAGGTSSGSITASTTTFLSGGAGGSGSTTGSGGNVATNYGYPTVSGGAGTTGGNGADGYFISQPILLSVGGAGGGGNAVTTGGNGGRGGIGSGGGGGGRGTTAGGAGGRGGDGAVFIWAW